MKGGQTEQPRMYSRAHTKAFVKTRPWKRGRCRTCHLFSASAGSPFKSPGPSVTGEGGRRPGSCNKEAVWDDEVRTPVPSDIKNSRSFFLGHSRDLGRPPSSAHRRVSAIYTLGQKKRTVIHHLPRPPPLPRWHM